jgi:hypothetical protein
MRPQILHAPACAQRLPHGTWRAFAIVALIAAATAAPPAQADGGCAGHYWVAPDGNDSAAGDAAHPLRTLEQARDAVRADPRLRTCALFVNLRGEFRRTGPLVLDARDSGGPGSEVTWRAAPGASAAISGAVRVTGWSLADPERNLYSAVVGPLRSRQLYVNGKRAVRAQSKPYPADYAPTASGYRYLLPPDTMPRWSDPSAVEAVTVTQWKSMRCPVAAVNGEEIVMQQPCWFNANVFQAVPPAAPLWSFILLTRWENALELLDEPGEWYLDSRVGKGILYYMPQPGEDMASAEVELPLAEVLLDGRGELGRPIEHLRFEGIAFRHATWLGPSGPNGYAADQSGFHLDGNGHLPNVIGHDWDDVRTPGNVRFAFARRVVFDGNTFEHLGAVALDFGSGSQENRIDYNTFDDVSAAAIQLGGIGLFDHHPLFDMQLTRDNRIANNLVHASGREYYDAAGIYLGFTTRSLVEHNEIYDVPWAGIAIGWGWGLLDPGSFPGLPNAYSGQWGTWDTPTASRGNVIVHNRIHGFLNVLWDGGAIYTQGRQGVGDDDAELIGWNVASGKRPAAGGNTFYTDGGSRYVKLVENVSYDNPVGLTDFGPCGLPSSLSLCWLKLPYGGDMGGCVPYGDLKFVGNYWVSPWFYDPCPYEAYPIDVTFQDNHTISGPADVPAAILEAAGRQPRNATSAKGVHTVAD